MLDGLRDQLAVVGELTVDQPRGEDHAVQLEDHLVLTDARGELGVLRLRSDTRKLLQRTSRDIGLELALEGLLQRCALDAQTVGVRGDHPQLAARRRDQDAGQYGPSLVFGRRARDALDRGDEGLRRQCQAGLSGWIWKRSE